MQTSPSERCQHIHTSGSRCGSPAIRFKRYCYYHRWPPRVANLVRVQDDPVLLHVPVFEDAHSIQEVLSRVTFHLLDGTLSVQRAGLALYALQIASANLKHIKQENSEATEICVGVEKGTGVPTVVPRSAVENQNDPESKQHEPKCDSKNQDCRIRTNEAKPEDEFDDGLPPGTIRARASSHRSERRPRYVN